MRSEETLAAWLITVTRRRAYAFLRAQKPQVPIEGFDAAVDARIETLEKEFEVEWALTQLPDRCEKLLRLLCFDIDEPRYVDIAQELRMPVASIGPTRARCLEKLVIDAPGVDIISAYPGGGYAMVSGTSFSAPEVAGAVA